MSSELPKSRTAKSLHPEVDNEDDPSGVKPIVQGIIESVFNAGMVDPEKLLSRERDCLTISQELQDEIRAQIRVVIDAEPEREVALEECDVLEGIDANYLRKPYRNTSDRFLYYCEKIPRWSLSRILRLFGGGNICNPDTEVEQDVLKHIAAITLVRTALEAREKPSRWK